MRNELDGYTEATAGPSSHTCGCRLVDATISCRRIILVCFDCQTYWHTGMFEGNLKASRIALARAADNLYRLPAIERRKYVREAKAEGRRIAERAIIRGFRRGKELAEIAESVDLPRQAVYRVLWTSGYRLRDRQRSTAQAEAAA